MQSDEVVISLRPGGGGGNRVSRSVAPRVESSLFVAGGSLSHEGIKVRDSTFESRERVRYSRDQLLQLNRVIDVPEEILKVKREIAVELHGEERLWGHIESDGQIPSQDRYFEPDNRDWRDRSEPVPYATKDQSWVNAKESQSRQQEISQLASVTQRPTPALVKAEMPWSSRRGNLSEKETVLKVVKGILNKLTPEKFDLLKGQLVDSGITSADILKGVITLIFDKAVLEPTFCEMYAQLCKDLNDKLPSFPAEEPGEKEVTFRRILLNNCQEAFEEAGNLRLEIRKLKSPDEELERKDKERLLKLRTLGNIRLIGELLKQKMVHEKLVPHIIQSLLDQDVKSCPEEENVEAICQFFITVGKQLDENPKNRHRNDVYFNRLKELTTNQQLASRLRFMVRDILDLRANKWVPRREGMKAKTISEIHTEAEKKLGLRPGAAAGMRNVRVAVDEGLSSSGFPTNCPGAGGLMPGMPATLKMPGMSELDGDGWEVPRSKSMSRSNPSNPQSHLFPKPSAINSKFLPQGTGDLISGKTSVLVQGPGMLPVRSSSFSSDSVEPPKPIALAPSMATNVAAARKINIEELHKKTVALLDEYFHVRILDEALECIKDLKSPDYHPEFVKEAVYHALDKGSAGAYVDVLVRLLEFLFTQKVITLGDLGTGCLLYASMLDDIAMDLPNAPSWFGEAVGKLVLSCELSLKLVEDMLKKVEDSFFRKVAMQAVLKSVEASSSFLEAHAMEVNTYRNLLA